MEKRTKQCQWLLRQTTPQRVRGWYRKSPRTDTTGDDVTSDPVLSKHLDIAIEAQDGKPKTNDTTEGADTERSRPMTPAKGSEAAKSR
jgi:hypothetical protein